MGCPVGQNGRGAKRIAGLNAGETRCCRETAEKADEMRLEIIAMRTNKTLDEMSVSAMGGKDEKKRAATDGESHAVWMGGYAAQYRQRGGCLSAGESVAAVSCARCGDWTGVLGKTGLKASSVASRTERTSRRGIMQKIGGRERSAAGTSSVQQWTRTVRVYHAIGDR